MLWSVYVTGLQVRKHRQSLRRSEKTGCLRPAPDPRCPFVLPGNFLGPEDFNRSFELAAEVVNLQRTVVITGPPNWDSSETVASRSGWGGCAYISFYLGIVEIPGRSALRP